MSHDRCAIFEDPVNPRTEFPDEELDELAADVRQHGILQPIVVHPADAARRWRIHFGAKRFRAARRAGLTQVPVTVRLAAADPYAQVAEYQKRHGLSPLDLARFIRFRVDQGDSNAFIAGRLGMDLTSVAHHLALHCSTDQLATLGTDLGALTRVLRTGAAVPLDSQDTISMPY